MAVFFSRFTKKRVEQNKATTSPTPCSGRGCGGVKWLSTARHPEGLRRQSPTPHGAAVARNRRFLEVLRSVSPAVGGSHGGCVMMMVGRRRGGGGAKVVMERR
ncbi:hypothetical protein Tco_1430295 [Tanacetum coccineum]